MSLDIDLYGKPVKTACMCCGHETEEPEHLFEWNITHNLGGMAKEAGIYEALWHPEEDATASRTAAVLRKGIERMEGDPEKFKAYDNPNGWGTYSQFLTALKTLLEAMESHPHATVIASR